MKKDLWKKTATILMAAYFAVLVSSCSGFFDKEQRITINLPPIQSASRSISSEKIGGLRSATASYRVIVESAGGERLEKSGNETQFSFYVYEDTTIEITVECLNSSGNVIVRAKKTHVVTSGLNEVNINLSKDGDEVINVPPAPQQPVPENVAEINGSGYTDFMDAFNAVQAGQTLKLLKNVSITSTLAISKNMTLDLNGFALSGDNSFGLISINDAGVTFTLNDSSNTNSGTLTGGSATTNGGGAVLIFNGKFIMNGGKISGNTANKGGGVSLISGTFEMNGGVITGNHSSSNIGGGVYVGGGTTVNISGNITVNNNTGGSSSVADNFMLQGVVLNITGRLTSSNNSIGVYYSGTNPFTSGWQANGHTAADKDIFFSDNTNKTITDATTELNIN